MCPYLEGYRAGLRGYLSTSRGASLERRAYTSGDLLQARTHPAIYAPASDGVGGGAYNDAQVDDEFYWAACELYLATNREEYRQFIQQSPHYLAAPSMTWGATQALGTISLAMVPGHLPEQDVAAARRNIVEAAGGFVTMLSGQGYRLPFAPGADGKYPWGSNSSVLNNMIILGLAYDFSGDATYLDAMVEGMDYILGRNPMDTSYVSGYGHRPIENPHHRFWGAHPARPIDWA
jgi:endoglucanase